MQLQQIRKEKGYSQWKLAKKSKVHQSRISLFENGLYVPNRDEIARLRQALNVDASLIEWPQGSQKNG